MDPAFAILDDTAATRLGVYVCEHPVVLDATAYVAARARRSSYQLGG